MTMNANEIIQKFKLNESTWTFKGFHGNLHTMFPVGEEALLFKDYFGDTVYSTLIFFKDNFGHWCWRDADMKRLREIFIAKVNKNPKYLNKLFFDWKKRLKKFDLQISKVKKTNLSKLSNQQLLQLYRAFYQAYIEEYALAVTIQDAFSMYSADFLEPAFMEFFRSRKMENRFAEYYSILMAPIVESFVTQELKDRWKIVQKIQSKPILMNAFHGSTQTVLSTLEQFPSIQKQIQKHAKKHFFVKNNYAVQVRLTPTRVIEDLVALFKENKDPLQELKQMEKQLKQNKTNKKQLIKQLSLPLQLQQLIKIAEVFTYMQDERKKYVLISNQYQRDFFEEIGRRLSSPKEEMEYSVFPELNEMLLEKKFDHEKLRERKKHSVIIQTQNSWQVFEGKVVDELFERLFSSEKKEVELKGLVASVGKATGRVRLIFKTHDFVNMQDGDILVTSMTRPEFVPIMKKAAAIVTDEGGITSHAAIVSRELGIPCIIGTKKATRVLKDGDMVEVDATMGIVRKILR